MERFRYFWQPVLEPRRFWSGLLELPADQWAKEKNEIQKTTVGVVVLLCASTVWAQHRHGFGVDAVGLFLMLVVVAIATGIWGGFLGLRLWAVLTLLRTSVPGLGRFPLDRLLYGLILGSSLPQLVGFHLISLNHSEGNTVAAFGVPAALFVAFLYHSLGQLLRVSKVGSPLSLGFRAPLVGLAVVFLWFSEDHLRVWTLVFKLFNQIPLPGAG